MSNSEARCVDTIVKTARYAGLAGLKNSDLLTAAEAKGFDVFLTVDQRIEYQHRTKSNPLNLLPLVSVCLEHVESIQPGQIVRIDR